MTKRQFAILHYIRKHHAETGVVPKLRETQEAVGVKHIENVWDTYLALVDKGFMKHTPEGYRLATWCPCCDGRLAA